MDASTESDDALMVRLRHGSEEAFRELFRRWRPALERFFGLLGADRHAAEDQVQETFLRLFAYRLRYRPAAPGFRAFAFRLARNVAVDAARRRTRARPTVPLDGAEHAAFAHSFARRDDHIDLRAAVDRLPAGQRLVVVLNVFAGLSYREVAAALEIPVGTVKSRMAVALGRLREVLRVDA